MYNHPLNGDQEGNGSNHSALNSSSIDGNTEVNSNERSCLRKKKTEREGERSTGLKILIATNISRQQLQQSTYFIYK